MMSRRLLGLFARNSDVVLFICTICAIALPFPTVGYFAADAWYRLHGEVVQGLVLETRRVSETHYTSESTMTFYVADVELVETGERIELRGINLYEGYVRAGDTIAIEAAPGGRYRPHLVDAGQYGVWKLTGSVWLMAVAVGWLVWRLRKRMASRGVLEAAQGW